MIMAVNHLPVHSQIFRELYRQETITGNIPHILSLDLNASTFFNNNEFFHTNTEGYTLTGAFFQPVLTYTVTGDLGFGLGIHLLKYNGRDEFARVMPFFKIDYRVTEKFRITMGSFDGGENFLLPEPLYKFENHFTNLVNNGIRLDFKGSRVSSLTWIDWEHFILPNDTLQEQFTFGSSDFITVSGNDLYTFEIPVHIVVHHQGGQINITDDPVISTLNLGAGFRIRRFLWGSEGGETWFNPMFFYDGNNETAREGIAWYPQMGLNFNPFSLTAGYFWGKRFESIHGEPLFFSPLRAAAGSVTDDTRSLVTFKAGIGKNITSSSSIILRFEGYYDTAINKLQYTYGLHMILNEDFLLLKPGRSRRQE